MKSKSTSCECKREGVMERGEWWEEEREEDGGGRGRARKRRTVRQTDRLTQIQQHEWLGSGGHC